jgi:HlyD family secretion protein
MIYAMLGVGFIVAILWGFLPKPVAVDTAKVSRGLLRVTVDEDGKTRIKEKYVVSAPLAGRLMRIDLHAADPVKAGETLLARIEPTDPALLDARVRIAREARVSAAEATVRQADATLSRAQAALDFAESELERARQLAPSKAVSQEEWEETQMRYRTCQADYKTAKFGQDIAGFELQQAEAALLRADPEGGTGHDPHFDIRSPINGRVLRVLQESTTVVQPGMPILEIGDPLDLEVEIDVLSADAVRIQPGAHVSLEHWGSDQPLNGMVRVVEPFAFTEVSALGVEEQRTNVIVDFVDPPENRRTLGDGFRVDARITVWEGGDVLKVPTGALFRHRGQWAVFADQEGHAELRLVELGHRNDFDAEVLKGLAEGDRVILYPNDRIENGVRVTPR